MIAIPGGTGMSPEWCALLSDYAEKLRDAEEWRLRGLYLGGSFAAGCGNESTSDVDIIVVLEERLVPRARMPMKRIHNKSPLPLDTIVVTVEQLNANAFPTPVECIVKEIPKPTLVFPEAGCREFLLRRQEVWQRGRALLGPPPLELFDRVPWRWLKQPIALMLPEIAPMFKNPVLMLCRVVYAYRYHELCSKREAGQWALKQLDAAWHETIRTALEEYTGGVRPSRIPVRRVREFEAWCRHALVGREVEEEEA